MKNKVFAKYDCRGCAYPCFASEEELEEIRKKQSESGVRTGYYGKCTMERCKSWGCKGGIK